MPDSSVKRPSQRETIFPVCGSAKLSTLFRLRKPRSSRAVETPGSSTTKDPGDAEEAGYVRSRIIFGEQLARLFAALFHRGMVSCFRHANTIQDIPMNVTLLCETQ